MKVWAQSTRAVSRVKTYKVWIFFLALTLIGVANFRKFGISWEAPALRLNGGNAAIYIADLLDLNIIPDYYRQFAPLGMNGMADHGVAYDVPLVLIERILGLSDTMMIYQFRTLINFLVFLIGTYAIYSMATRRFNSRNIGLFAASIFVLSPRIFAAGFYSPSDMIFASFFALGINYSIKFLKDNRISSAILAGLISGFATDIRLLGIVAGPIILTSYILHNYQLRKLKVKGLLYYSGAFIFSVYLFFPYLWANPLVRFIEVFRSLSKYNWAGKDLYFGEHIAANNLPWHYIPVWIAITTPIFYLICFALGVFSILNRINLFRRLDFQSLQDLIFLGLFIFPIITVIFLNSVLYDSWRHLFFVYPFFVLVAVKGWTSFFKTKKQNSKLFTLKIAVTVTCLLQVIFWMALNNPKEYLYFNCLAGRANLQQKWEMDYLGLANKDVIEYIFAHTQQQKVTVGVGSFTPFDMSLKVVPKELRDRMTVVSISSHPDYIINNFRDTSADLKENLNGYHVKKRFTIDNSIYFELWEKTQ